MSEAQLLLASVLVTSGYLLYRVLEAGLLGSLSARYFEWAGRSNERKKLEFALTAEKATLHFKAPVSDNDAKSKFEEQVDKVPVDEATGEAIISGPLYTSWLNETRKALVERAVEAIATFRVVDMYFRDTYCKMSQGYASSRAWKEAEEARGQCEQEFQEIADWASKLKSGWEQKILMEASKLVDEKQKRQMEKQHQEEMRQQQDILQRQQERVHAKLLASQQKYAANVKTDADQGVAEADSSKMDEKRIEELAKAAQEELLSEEEKKNPQPKRKAGKKGKE